jgi:septum formation protein
MKIILASQSEPKKKVLSQIFGDGFVSVNSTYEEDNTLDVMPTELVMKHALGKAKDVAASHPRDVVIGADTVIVCDDEILGKPHTADNAKLMLEKISGKTIEVVSGISVIRGENIITDNVITEVKIKNLSEKEIDAYVETGEPLDKAGAFAIQGLGAFLVEEVKGCYFNIVGMPLFRLAEILEEFDVHVFD